MASTRIEDRVTDAFPAQFERLTGQPPFPWQAELFRRMCDSGDHIPSRCDIPTGLGKTSVIAVWLLARAVNQNLPRRLVYVVNRRTVVDQTTDEVQRYRHVVPDLRISTLRGQFADNRDWSADPSKPAVICGTVDMIGSRLLFSGYGVGFKGRPLHAGLLGQDALIVHDEAHLEPAFQDLLKAIEKEQQNPRCRDRFRLRVMELSATSRDQGDRPPLRLTPEERAATKDSPGVLGVVGERFRATKRLHLHPQADKSPGAQLAKLALDKFKDSGRAVLIFTRTIDYVTAIAEELRKAKFEPAMLIGPMRGLERERLTDPRNPDGSPVFARFLPPPKPDTAEAEKWKVTPVPGTAYLVCTSAGEVGVNISADHMASDLSTFDSMAQRFGRVNRFGRRNDSEIHVIHPTAFDEKKPSDPQRKLTLALLQRLNGDASPAALSEPLEDRVAAFAPLPDMLPTSDILFDTWSMTSIRDAMPGRPPVEPYLHGVPKEEQPETQVAWREEVHVIRGDLLTEYPPEDLLDEYPLKPHELLGDRSERVHKELVKLAERHGDAPVWLIDDYGKVVVKTLTDVADEKSGRQLIERKRLLLPHNVGGLTQEGLLNGEYPKAPKDGEPPASINNDVADVQRDEKGRRLRVRVWSDDPRCHEESFGMRLVRPRIDLPDDEDGTDDGDDAPRSWHWFERPIPNENSKNAVAPVLLDTHVKDVEEHLRDILSPLTLDPDPQADAKLKRALQLAAKYHDLGKHRELWQRSIGRPLKFGEDPVEWFGKSGRGWKPRKIGEYRHEFGSLVDLQAQPDFQALDDDDKDLVQHLIAAHHGQARPHFAAEQIIDPDHRTADCEALAVEVPRRFARLQRKFGRWGLAYIESLLRAADYAASATPTRFYEEATQ